MSEFESSPDVLEDLETALKKIDPKFSKPTKVTAVSLPAIAVSVEKQRKSKINEKKDEEEEEDDTPISNTIVEDKKAPITTAGMICNYFLLIYQSFVCF